MGRERTGRRGKSKAKSRPQTCLDTPPPGRDPLPPPPWVTAFRVAVGVEGARVALHGGVTDGRGALWPQLSGGQAQGQTWLHISSAVSLAWADKG